VSIDPLHLIDLKSAGVFNPNIQQLANDAFQAGGLSAALAAVKTAPDTAGAPDWLRTAAASLGYGSGAVDQFLGQSTSTAGSKVSSIDALVQLANSQTSDKGIQASNIRAEIAALQALPPSQEVSQKITELTDSINTLTGSTNSLNATNQDLLSPYYTQDPRTSHIGFRSQGMASGGSVDVPGGISANDNMIAMIPVASGERISVDPMSSKRGVGGTSIYMPITIQGGANRDDIGRTMYQAGQSLSRQLAAAGR